MSKYFFAYTCLAMAAMPVLADPATSPDTVTKKPTTDLAAINVVYSSTKTETPTVDIPQSVTVITPDEMHTRGVQGLDEAVRYTAGVVGGSYGFDQRSDWLLVRGYDPARFLDGLALPNGVWTGGSRIETYGLERIEVNKGPSSAMYGQLPPGGMVDMTSKRPSLEAPREVEATVGSFGQRQLAADVGGQLDEAGRVLFRLVGLARKSDTPLDFSRDDRYYFAPSLSWKPDDDTSFTLLARYQRSISRGVAGFLPSQGTLFGNPNGHIPASRYSGEPDYDRYAKTDASIGYQFTHRFNDTWSVRQDLRTQDAEVAERSVGGLGLESDLRTLDRYTFPLVDHARVFAVDNQVEGHFQGNGIDHTVLAGVDYLRSRNEYKSGFGSAPTLDIFDPVYGATIPDSPYTSRSIGTLRQTGAYLQDQMQIGAWGIVASGREDWVTNDTDDRFADTHVRQRDKAFSGRLGVNYRFDSGVVPYLAYSHSFKTTVGQTFAGKAFEPITGDQYEAGVKYATNDNRSLFTAAVYQLTQRNALTVDPEHIFFSLQQGRTRTRGVELEAQTAVTDSLSLTAAYAFTHARVIQASDATMGKRVPLVPKHQASISADYAVRGGNLNGLGFGGGVRYVGAHYGDANNLFPTGGYVLVDANTHYDFDSWRVQVTATNLFGRQYITACNSAAWCYYGYPRALTASLRFRW
jgi:iron complex outermembrane receptor protein